MKLLSSTPAPAPRKGLLLRRPVPAADVPVSTPVLTDTDHTSGKMWRVQVSVNEGQYRITCRARGNYPGLAANRAWGLAHGYIVAQRKKDSDGKKLRLRTVTFECEVDE